MIKEILELVLFALISPYYFFKGVIIGFKGAKNGKSVDEIIDECSRM